MRGKFSALLPLTLLVLVSAASCTAVVRSPPTRQVVVVESNKPGPPPWAPAHGYRRKHEKYYYYPVVQVYYYPTAKRYVWLEAGEWKVGVRAPTRVVLVETERIELELDHEPHLRHTVIKSQYPPDFFEKKGKAKGKWKD